MGRIIEIQKEKDRAVVQLSPENELIKFHFDDICEIVK